MNQEGKTSLLIIAFIIIMEITATDVGMIAYFQVQCPQDWQLYVPAKQKFIFTAGNSFTTGSTGGQFSHVLTISEMPSHSHVITALGRHGANGAWAADFYTSWGDVGHESRSKTSSQTGGNAAHNNMPPYLTLIACKKIAETNNSSNMNQSISIMVASVSLLIGIVSIIVSAVLCCKRKRIKKDNDSSSQESISIGPGRFDQSSQSNK